MGSGSARVSETSTGRRKAARAFIVVAALVAAGAVLFLVLSGHLVADDPPLTIHDRSEREKREDQARERKAKMDARQIEAEARIKSAGDHPSGNVQGASSATAPTADLPPDPEIALIARDYDLGRGWAVTVKAGGGATVLVSAKHRDRHIGANMVLSCLKGAFNDKALVFNDHGDRMDVHVGTPGADVMFVNPAAAMSVLFGMGGDDVMTGGPCDEIFHGGTGHIAVSGGGGNDTILPGPDETEDSIWGDGPNQGSDAAKAVGVPPAPATTPKKEGE
jgi:hypothetical protein